MSKVRKLNGGQIMDALESQGREFGGAGVRSDYSFTFVAIGSKVSIH